MYGYSNKLLLFYQHFYCCYYYFHHCCYYYCYYYYHCYYYCYSRTFKLVKTDTNVSRNKPYYGEYYCKGGEKLQIFLFTNKNDVKFTIIIIIIIITITLLFSLFVKFLSVKLSLIQSNCRKRRTRKNSGFGYFKSNYSMAQ